MHMHSHCQHSGQCSLMSVSLFLQKQSVSVVVQPNHGEQPACEASTPTSENTESPLCSLPKNATKFHTVKQNLLQCIVSAEEACDSLFNEGNNLRQIRNAQCNPFGGFKCSFVLALKSLLTGPSTPYELYLFEGQNNDGSNAQKIF